MDWFLRATKKMHVLMGDYEDDIWAGIATHPWQKWLQEGSWVDPALQR